MYHHNLLTFALYYDASSESAKYYVFSFLAHVKGTYGSTTHESWQLEILVVFVLAQISPIHYNQYSALCQGSFLYDHTNLRQT